ncbi:BspA family leucine-rich repeat surface protein [Pseudoflavonifractor phocaeensis]|nr:BspA family leucine-rich repeat surface protein [Pseudoflavonifractor phocaeensis]
MRRTEPVEKVQRKLGFFDRLVLMSDPCEVTNGDDAYTAPVFGTELRREEIGTVTFLDNLNSAPNHVRDVSQNQDGSVVAWWEQNGVGYYDLFIAAEGGVSAPQDASYLFRGYRNVTGIYFNGAFDTENVTKLDLSSFDTSKVTGMLAMFYRCSNLTELDVSGFDTSQTVEMKSMFYGCSGLSELDVSNFDTSQVKSMEYLFFGCSSLNDLDMSSFDTSQVTNMYGMFAVCSNLSELNVSSFDTSQVTDMRWMFGLCYGLQELDVSGFDISQVVDMYGMFDGVPESAIRYWN